MAGPLHDRSPSATADRHLLCCPDPRHLESLRITFSAFSHAAFLSTPRCVANNSNVCLAFSPSKLSGDKCKKHIGARAPISKRLFLASTLEAAIAKVSSSTAQVTIQSCLDTDKSASPGHTSGL